ncbi:AraC family transcriptional regulator [Cellulophaga sp. F20128]|uniref:AraC family transcriptional regulator n=1 Tax=Cellulophaga sp. F20128 TaxID=2926413 RepID=UPI001FF6F164|nr:AraC family transcriptional regulator [Cellulophaga sp. F20128]MCK0156496.1 AraC family transcriptional regulator [Cellulophaga sp. F20128]
MNHLKYAPTFSQSSSFCIENDTIESSHTQPHKQFKVTLIVSGKGSLVVLDRVVKFKKGDVFLFGINSPNVLLNSEKTKKDHEASSLKTVSLLCDQDKIENSLKNVNEAYRIKKLLEQIDFGVKVSKSCSKQLGVYLSDITEAKGIKRLLLFLKILHLVSRDEGTKFLSSKAFPKRMDYDVNSKISNVYKYVKVNHHKKISLEQVAEKANMSPTAFCRFFKAKSKKTFSQYLIEIRIGNACTLLYDQNISVEDSCYSSGYNSLSNFHKHFKRVMGMSPSEYRTIVLNK